MLHNNHPAYVRLISGRRKKQATTEKKRLRWLKTYKLLACIAFCALAMPYVEIISLAGARDYTTFFTWITTISMFSIGYGIHTCLRVLLPKGSVQEEMSFSFETKRQFSSPMVFIPSIAFSVIIALFFGCNAGNILEPLLYPYYSKEIGFPLILFVCVVIAASGCLLVNLQFYQICSLRTALEGIAALGLPYGFAIWWGNGVNSLFCLCVIVYTLCLFILMNQEYVIKPSYNSKTCYATQKLRLSGIKEAIKLWLLSLFGALLILALLSVFVTTFRFLFYTNRNTMLVFPFVGWPTVNLVLFLIGIAIFPMLIGFLLLRFTNARIFRYLEGLFKQFWSIVKTPFFSFFRLRFRKKTKKTSDKKDLINEEHLKQHYVDIVTISDAKEKRTNLYHIGYREFITTLKKKTNFNSRYQYAYEVLIEELWREQIGVEAYQTPLEMSRIIISRTNIGNMDTLTDIYMSITYGENCVASADDIEKICSILETRLVK